MKKLMIILMFLITISLVNAAVECQISTDNSNWVDIDVTSKSGCVDNTADLSYSQNLQASTQYYVRCDDTSNSSTTWGYKTITTNDGGENEPMAALAIMIFVLLINGVLFALPFVKRDFVTYKSRNVTDVVNFIIRRSVLSLAIYMMVLTSTIAATIASKAELGLTSEMFLYMNIFGWVGYTALIVLVTSTIFKVYTLYSVGKEKGRMEDEQ